MFGFTKQKQLSRAAFGHRTAATLSGGSTFPALYPDMPAMLPLSTISVGGPCPRINAHQYTDRGAVKRMDNILTDVG